MGIEYLDKTHAKLIVTRGSGKNRQRKVKRITYTSKKDAARQYNEFLASISFDIDGKMTVAELVSWYIDEFVENGGKATTARGYRTASKAIAEYFGKTRANSVSLNKIQSWIKKQDCSPKTIKNRLSLLNSAYVLAIRRGLLKSNPCEYAVIPKQEKPDIVILQEDDIQRFLSALESASLDFKVACELALFCGLRRSELYGLYKSDITNTVTIKRVRHRINGQEVIQTPKTKSSMRTLAVPEFIQVDVRQLIEQQKSRPDQSEFLLLNDFGEPVGHYWCTRNLNRLIENNGLPKITMHGLRHTYASMLIHAGIPIAEVSAQLGHASIDITLRTYTHLFTDASTASKRISDFLDNKWHQSWHQ